MYYLRDIGRELRAISCMMLEDVESVLKEMDVFHYVFDRKESKILIYSQNPSDKQLLFIVKAVPRANQLVVYYVGKARPALINPQKTSAVSVSPIFEKHSSPETECTPSFHFRWNKHCRKELTFVLLKLLVKAQ